MLSARNITKCFAMGSTWTEVLRDVSLDIEQGEFLSIVGRSGSGKTTLLNVLSTLVKPDKGEVFYGERLLTARSSSSSLNSLRRSDFAVIFQFHHLLPYLSVLQNTLLPFMRSFRPVPGEIVTKAERTLEKIGLGDKCHNLPGNLSGGEQQRVAIARAMVTSARVLFADEPTGSLDKATGEEIMNLLAELHREGMTIIMVTHEPQYARRAQRTVELSDGRVVH